MQKLDPTIFDSQNHPLEFTENLALTRVDELRGKSFGSYLFHFIIYIVYFILCKNIRFTSISLDADFFALMKYIISLGH